ncbi:putative cobalt transporter subunit CbtA [Amycolatopsis sulphurea]|uniref:Putative cobalt transporter subunit CbtA n=1 Tax=Amycolatopsis sulphurea TaxID=76022 RepID=A0A2A9FHL7_9PSEU|nr:CbtA family protein [Amycolatopsis sulphurea]PFG50957.1 putative cobalt transporter subunit CbtA [Amycolatopsis sulphurea]
MERKLILRGLLAGALGGLFAFVFARIFAEPPIQAAIDYEAGRDEVQSALDKAAGMPMDSEGPELFSRAVQGNLGIGLGMVLFGVAMGALFAVVYTVLLGRVGRVRARVLALLVSGAGFVCLYLVPFLKYPANPPAVGNHATIGARTGLYLVMVAAAVLFLVAALLVGKRLAPKLGSWNAALVAGAAFVVLTGILMALLPSLGDLAGNVAEHGAQGTETPLPLKDAAGQIVYPGFPADTLFEFRLYSVLSQVVLWGTIALVFGPLAERVLHRGRPAEAVAAA